MNDTTQTIIRSILKVGGGYLTAKGYADNAKVELIIGGLVALIGVVLGFIKSRKTEAAK